MLSAEAVRRRLLRWQRNGSDWTWLWLRASATIFGAAIVDELEKEGVDCRLVRRCRGKQSPVSAVMIDRSGERMIVNFKDPASTAAQTGFHGSCPSKSMAF